MWIQCRQNQLHMERTRIVHTTSGGISTVKGFFPCRVQTDVLAANIWWGIQVVSGRVASPANEKRIAIVVKCTYSIYKRWVLGTDQIDYIFWERARMSHTAKDRDRHVADSMDIGSTGPLSTADPCWPLMTPFCCSIMTPVWKKTHNKLKPTNHSIVKTKFEETSCIAEDAKVAAANCSSNSRRRSDCTHFSAASTLLLVDALMRTFYCRLSSPPHRRSDCARTAATSALLPMDSLIAHLWQLSSLSTLWLRAFCSRLKNDTRQIKTTHSIANTNSRRHHASPKTQRQPPRAPAFLPVDALIAHVLQPLHLSCSSTLWLRTFFSRFSSHPRRRSDCARSAAASDLILVDALIAHVRQPPQLSSPSTLWLRTFCSRLSSPPVDALIAHVLQPHKLSSMSCVVCGFFWFESVY